MVIKVYGAPTAWRHLVICVLEEKKVPYEYILVDIFNGEQRSPEFLEKQPFGQTPYIDDDGFILYESRAIAIYIATKYADQGTPLIPSDIKAQALFHQAASIEVSHFNGPAFAATVEKLYKPVFRGLECDQAVFEKNVAELGLKLDVYERILEKQRYIAGDFYGKELTLADLYHLPYGRLMGIAGTDLMTSRPNVNRCVVRILSGVVILNK
ncbi:hypothetical protein NLJ89_g8909 [Agrocybe chaxingu]|uniref:glutathione transferase n=1 Tax=Agrocybe chaxingu TaxID=84603 RepID=A0A9W8JU12_9AGAR|nr:hypothetical protein NLJ89_g8909 [Agrocybe chaxingu]